MSEKSVSAKAPKTPKAKPVARKDMTKAQWIWKEMKRNYVAYIMCAPFFLIFFTFTILPVILSQVHRDISKMTYHLVFLIRKN